MTYNQSFTIRPMKTDDLGQALGLSNSEGWNQTENDWKLLLENPLNTCIAAEYNSQVIGTATALNHSGKVAWIGMVLVDKSFRGQGIGKMLLKNIIDALKDIDSIKLDATPAGLPLYRKLGFIEEYIIYRMINPSLQNSKNRTFKYEPVYISQADFKEVLKLDKSIFGTSRTYLLNALLSNYPGKAYLIKRDKKPDGYIFGREGVRFNYIGPVIADSDDSVRILVLKAFESLDQQPVAIDILQDKEEIIKWLESMGFAKQRHFIRMYLRSNAYHGSVKNYYFISGPEFG